MFPYRLNQSFEKVQDLRYGENPHQRAAFYSDMGSTMYSVAAARVLQGKELSFNNILDLDSAWRLVTDVEGTACAIIKHTNPCGVGRGASLEEAFSRAWDCDPTSAFGGIIALSQRCDGGVAAKITASFFEAVIAPGFSAEAKAILAAEEEPSRARHGRHLHSSRDRLRSEAGDGRRARPGVGHVAVRSRAGAIR